MSFNFLNQPTSWTGLFEPSDALAIAEFVQDKKHPLFIVTDDLAHAYRLQEALTFFLKDTKWAKLIYLFPDWETLPYDTLSPHRDIISERIKLLTSLPNLSQGILIVSITTLLYRLPPNEYMGRHNLVLRQGDQCSLNQFKQKLIAYGYRACAQVTQHGEFAPRGGLIDLFPNGSILPFRIEWVDDQIASLRTFNPETQCTIKVVSEINVLTAQEYDCSNQGKALFQKHWSQLFPSHTQHCSVFQAVMQDQPFPGIEYYLPLFFSHTTSLLSYLPPSMQIMVYDNLSEAVKAFTDQLTERYQQLQATEDRSLLPPSHLLLPLTELNTALLAFELNTITRSTSHSLISPIQDILPAKALLPALTAMVEWIAKAPKRRALLVISAAHHQQVLQAATSLVDTSQWLTVKSWNAFITSSNPICMIHGFLPQGLVIHPNWLIITETELFEHPISRRPKRTSRIDPHYAIKSLAELTIGTPVVHVQHGIGLYQGLHRFNDQGIENEFLTLEYAGGDKIYVPVTALPLIHRYTATDQSIIPLTTLGSEQWQRTKKKVLKHIHDAAAELLEIYAKREAQIGFQFNIDPEHYAKFADQFPFEETPDQAKAIEATLADMASTRPMDRLICGDVGFGKTEVAMRAAFIAVQNKKQVAILVPTTILALQHFQSFVERFSEFGIKVTHLTRLHSLQQTQQTIAAIASGAMDIVIGTHKLFSSQLSFADLGLLIIDEEHRFGVKQKEYFKSKRTQLDILTLTATPIPRTLNIALSGLRDISIIASPPARRLTIQTFVLPRRQSIIREAITRELMRAGQVYYLHNNVKTLPLIQRELQSLVPKAKIAIAHGQMSKKQLETIMHDFYHNRYHVLLCTTIIENGIDVPTANTILIDRADKLGLAQLHQLRGRVGRSHHQAYAYLMAPFNLLSADGQKRLNAIVALGELGAGFTLATHDLEIRGAGELLGEEQSGSIASIGYHLYTDLLEKAIEHLKQQSDPLDTPLENSICEVNLQLPALIPERYVWDVQQRLVLYKRIADTKDKQALTQLQAELVDRFGPLPIEVKYLLLTTALQQLGERYGISKIQLSQHGGYIRFNANPKIDLKALINLIQSNPRYYQFRDQQQIQIRRACPTFADRLDCINQLLQVTQPPTSALSLDF